MVSIKRFFENDEKQKEYEDRVDELIKKMKKKFKGFYEPAFHDELIMELARSEITIFDLQKQIEDGRVADDTPRKLLQQERTHIRSIWDQLQINMKGQRGDIKHHAITAGKDFKSFMESSLMELFEIEDDEEDEEDETD